MAAGITDSRNSNRVPYLTGVFKIVNVKVNDGTNEKVMPLYIENVYPAHIHKQSSGLQDKDASGNRFLVDNYIVTQQNDYRYLLKQFSPKFQDYDKFFNSSVTFTKWKLRRNSAFGSQDYGEDVILQTKGVYGSVVEGNLNPVIGGQLDFIYEIIKVFGPSFSVTYPVGTNLPVNKHSATVLEPV